MKLRYRVLTLKRLFYADGVNPCYNGNISAKQLPAGRYDYYYDKNNRLIMAEYSGDSSGSDFSASYSYDDRGNITSLTRMGVIDKAAGIETFGILDNLALDYSGNQIKSVSAATESFPFDGITGVGQNKSDMSLSYDASGRVCADETRGIFSIEYDNDGHPVRIIFESGNEQRDIWDGLGNHLATEYYTPNSMEGKQPFVTKRYGGDGQIECQLGPEIGIPNKVLTYTSFPGGYFDQDGAPHYYISDYQCNHAYGYILPATQSKKYIQSLHSNIQPDEVIPCIIENAIRTSIGDPVRMSYQTIMSLGKRHIDKRQLLFYTNHDYNLINQLKP